MAEPKAKKSPWAKFGKALHVIVVAAFFLPFFGISCRDKDSGESADVLTMSGVQMAAGCRPGGLLAEAEEQSEKYGGKSGDDGEMKIENLKVEPLAIIALLLAVAGVLVAFLAKGKQAVMGSLITSVLCLGTVVGIWIKVGGEIDHGIMDKMKSDMGSSVMTRDADVDSGPRMGLFIALGCLAACAALAGVALRDRSSMPDVVPPGGPEGPGSSMV